MILPLKEKCHSPGVTRLIFPQSKKGDIFQLKKSFFSQVQKALLFFTLKKNVIFPVQIKKRTIFSLQKVTSSSVIGHLSGDERIFLHCKKVIFSSAKCGLSRWKKAALFSVFIKSYKYISFHTNLHLAKRISIGIVFDGNC